MGLLKYFAKRNFSKTSEPKGKKKSATAKALRFVVQKHDARRLHYDFRLECNGVLLSWAIPKGPSLNPHDKRLAIHVEDHPLDYQYFEGIIPKGNYGAGKVEIWDKGIFLMWDAQDPKEIEKKLIEGVKKGHFAIILHGEKLKGEFIFQKLKKDSDDNAWLCIKKNDTFASSDNGFVENEVLLKKAKKLKMPQFIPPMLAQLVDKPFNDENWLFEIKWDGFRSLAFIEKGKALLKSRTDQSWSEQFSLIAEALKKIKGQAILDGEIVVLDDEGKSHFQLIQNYQNDKSHPLCYYVFDLLYKDGHDLRDLPLIERKKLLHSLIEELQNPLIRYSEHILEKGISFFKAVKEKHLEGIIAKKINSTYESRRSSDWLKIKTSLRQEVVIGGFTEPRGSRKKFGALLVGVYNKDKELEYVGHVGGGFNGELLDKVYGKLNPLIQKKSPFLKEPKSNTPVTWVKPKLMGEVSFSEWTKDNIMRQPIFQGLRSDKNPSSIKKEIPVKPLEGNSSKKTHLKNLKVSLTNVDKIYWPEEGYTKGDLLKYYQTVAPYILPYLKNRPIFLHRYPDGINGISFYQKDIKFSHPEWLKTTPIKHEGKVDNYLMINNLDSLLYAINLGSIDLHPFMTLYDDLDHPTYCVIDLDPHDISFDKAIEAALVVHELLDSIDVPNYCKTSGGNGLHIVIPLGNKYTYEQSRQFAEIIASIVHQKLPKTTSLERSPKKRLKKIYLDCLQNRTGQSIASPYSVRPRPQALVSTPLEWKEVNSKLKREKFNLKTMPARLKSKGDLFLPTLKKGIDIDKALKRLQKILSKQT